MDVEIRVVDRTIAGVGNYDAYEAAGVHKTASSVPESTPQAAPSLNGVFVQLGGVTAGDYTSSNTGRAMFSLTTSSPQARK